MFSLRSFVSVTSIVFSLAAIVSVTATTACNTKAKAGDKCEPNTGACLDPTNRLVCQDGVYVASACKGANGCKVEGDKITCDISGNVAGDTCTKSLDKTGACAADKKGLVGCFDGKYSITKCNGPKGCFADGTSFSCDMSQASLGDHCEGADTACSQDGKSWLACNGTAFTKKADCNGPKGCVVTPTGDTSCDMGAPAAAGGGEHAPDPE